MRPRLSLRLLLLVLPAFLATQAWAGAAPLRLSVSVAPLTWLVQQLGGDQVQVQTLVRSGQDPHAYEPTPGQLTVLQGADSYLGMDLPFERAWLPRVRAANPDLRVVMLVDDHGASTLDPHLWVDPNNMVNMAGQVTELLVALRPGQAGFFAANRQRLVAKLMALDRELASRFATLSRKTFLVHHPAWGHLAARYGLIQLAIEQEGKSLDRGPWPTWQPRCGGRASSPYLSSPRPASTWPMAWPTRCSLRSCRWTRWRRTIRPICAGLPMPS